MTFVIRQLQASFTLAGGTSGGLTQFDNGSNTANLPLGLRMSAKIAKAGGRAMGEMNLQIYGMTKSLMDQLSTLGVRVGMLQKSFVTLQAGDAQSGMAPVFIGSVLNAYAEYGNQPDVPFNVQAFSGAFEAVQTIPPTSYNGGTDIVTVMSGLATQANLNFVNGGVTGKLPKVYLSGSPRQQMLKAAEAAGIAWQIDNSTLYIWPKNGQRGSSGVLVSPQTGMIGYPSYAEQGIVVRTLFNPSIGLGQTIQVQSSLKKASTTWAVANYDLHLETLVPHGKWEQTLYCYNPSYAFPVK
jgi:hypothetical protein